MLYIYVLFIYVYVYIAGVGIVFGSDGTGGLIVKVHKDKCIIIRILYI